MSNTGGSQIGKGVPAVWANFSQTSIANFSTWMKSIRTQRSKRSMNWGSVASAFHFHWGWIEMDWGWIKRVDNLNQSNQVSQKLFRDSMYFNQTKHCCCLSNYIFQWFHFKSCRLCNDKKKLEVLYYETGAPSQLVSSRKDYLICFHILHFGKEICLDNSSWVAWAQDHIVGRPKESGIESESGKVEVKIKKKGKVKTHMITLLADRIWNWK